MLRYTKTRFVPWRESGHCSAYFDAGREASKGLLECGIEIPEFLLSASRARVAEFIAGRLCAKAALRQLGATPIVGVAVGGRPSWSNGYVGSITHTSGFASAAVAPSSELLGIGIDSEWLFSDMTARDLSTTIMSPAELEVLHKQCPDVVGQSRPPYRQRPER